jgi:hypothetical protein
MWASKKIEENETDRVGFAGVTRVTYRDGEFVQIAPGPGRWPKKVSQNEKCWLGCAFLGKMSIS